MMFWYAQLRSLPSFSTKNLIPQMCTSLSKNKLLIAGCTCLAIGFISALSGIMTSVWAVKEYSDNQGFFKSVTFGLWHFRRCGGFRINGECNKGELQQTDIQYFGAEGLFALFLFGCWSDMHDSWSIDFGSPRSLVIRLHFTTRHARATCSEHRKN